LYAIVEELRAVAPRRRSARELAGRYEVSVRTIERDLSALQQAGVPIYAEPGRTGGYALNKELSLPPLNFTPAEAVAVAVALAKAGDMPFDSAGQSAMRKIVAAMSERDAVAARTLVARVRLLEPVDPLVRRPSGSTEISATIERAMADHQVLRVSYLDRHGALTERDLEPIAFVGGPRAWYLVAWCRLRDEGRCFRVDRIRTATVTGLPAPQRAYEECSPRLQDLVASTPAL